MRHYRVSEAAKAGGGAEFMTPTAMTQEQKRAAVSERDVSLSCACCY